MYCQTYVDTRTSGGRVAEQISEQYVYRQSLIHSIVSLSGNPGIAMGCHGYPDLGYAIDCQSICGVHDPCWTADITWDYWTCMHGWQQSTLTC